MDADDRATAWGYLVERSHQTAIDGWQPLSHPDEPEPLVDAHGVEWGVCGRARHERDRVIARSIYVYASQRGRGHLRRALAPGDAIVTTPDCQIEATLAHLGATVHVAARISETREYRAIDAHYGDRRAARSGVRMIRHIDEGLTVLAHRAAGERAMRAYCLHPLVQRDDDLAAAFPRLAKLTDDLAVLALALEYRNIANATLSTRTIASAADIPLSPLAEVTEMLVADKLQNWKDFVLHHRATHPRSADSRATSRAGTSDSVSTRAIAPRGSRACRSRHGRFHFPRTHELRERREQLVDLALGQRAGAQPGPESSTDRASAALVPLQRQHALLDRARRRSDRGRTPACPGRCDARDRSPAPVPPGSTTGRSG